jgi:hypothetical protein
MTFETKSHGGGLWGFLQSPPALDSSSSITGPKDHQQELSRRTQQKHQESRESSPQGFKLDNCDCSAKEEQNRRPSGGFNHELKS